MFHNLCVAILGWVKQQCEPIITKAPQLINGDYRVVFGVLRFTQSCLLEVNISILTGL